MITLRQFILITLLFVVGGMLNADDHITPTPPPPAPLIDTADDDVTTVLLMGSATEYGDSNPGLTDTLMLVSIHRKAGSIAVLSLPRDLWVYVPARDEMAKINQVYYYGEAVDDTGGVASLKQVITHNFGLTIDYYARVDFRDFSTLIDQLGGIELAVDCIIRDWKLIEPDLDKQDPDNWEMYTLRNGLRHLDGELALWYVRSRRTSSDLDRNRRQQDVLRAIWRQIKANGLMSDFPALWDEVTRIVETDATLDDVLGLLPMASTLDLAGVQYYRLEQNKHMISGYSPGEGRFIFELQPDALYPLLRQFITPPTKSRIHTDLPLVGIVNVTGNRGMGHVAAQRLEVEGFRTVLIDEPSSPREYNKIIDYTGATKGNPVGVLQRIFRVTGDGIEETADPQRTLDYKLYLGWRYNYWSCTYPVQQPDLDAEEREQSD